MRSQKREKTPLEIEMNFLENSISFYFKNKKPDAFFYFPKKEEIKKREEFDKNKKCLGILQDIRNKETISTKNFKFLLKEYQNTEVHKEISNYSNVKDGYECLI